MPGVDAATGHGRVLLDGAALADGRAQAGIGRVVGELSRELTALAPRRVRLVVPPGRPRSESRPGRQVHAERTLLPLAWRELPPLVHCLGGEPLLGWPGRRQVVTVHDLELWNDAGGPRGLKGDALHAYRGVVGLGLRRCAALIAVSSTVRAEVVERLAIPPGRIRVVPHGLGAAFGAGPGVDDARLRATAGAPQDYLLWVGSLRVWDPRKALDVLIGALGRMGPRAPRLLLAGAPGAAGARALSLAEAVGVSAQALGAVDDRTLAALYRGASAVLVPSRHEGFGLPALEAMACGAPLICTTAGNLPALAEGVAHLVPPDDPAALAGAIAVVLADRPAARRQGLAGVPRARAHTWRRAAEQTLAVYDSLLAPRPG